MKTRLFALFAVLLGFAACKKEESKPTTEQLLSGKEWQLVQMVEKQGTTDPHSSIAAINVICDKTGSFILRPDKTTASSSVEGNCLLHQHSSNATWEYIEAENWLRFEINGSPYLEGTGTHILEISEEKVTFYNTHPTYYSGTGAVIIYYLQAI